MTTAGERESRLQAMGYPTMRLANPEMPHRKVIGRPPDANRYNIFLNFSRLLPDSCRY
jgi:hypothetical protein